MWSGQSDPIGWPDLTLPHGSNPARPARATESHPDSPPSPSTPLGRCAAAAFCGKRDAGGSRALRGESLRKAAGRGIGCSLGFWSHTTPRGPGARVSPS